MTSTIAEIDTSQSASARSSGTAEAIGRLAAEAFDLRLRQAEAREREERLAELCDRLGGNLVAEPGADLSNLLKVRQLEAQVEGLLAFHHAVLHSKGWRLLQALRRLVGRAW